MSPLNRKLLRDLWRMKGQAVAIGLVIAMGVMMLVMMTGLVSSLDETRRTYYERYRLAEVFAPVARAPTRLIAKLARIPGVGQAEGRVIGSALIDLPGRELPVQARVISLPDQGEPRLNDLYLTDGRKLNGARADEILLLQSFALAHGLRPGDALHATMNGARRSFRIAGLVRSPEFLYTTAPGELVPDDGRYGVIWINRSTLGAAYDMRGAFNEAILSLGRNANSVAVMAEVDRLLDPYGGLGAYGLEDQASNRFISEEINGLRVQSIWVPPIFLAVAAFLLYIVISRIVQAEREEIGLMKAFGYTNPEVGSHYMKLVLVIAIGGAIAGSLMGVAAGRALIDVYTGYFKFPFLVFRLEPISFVVGLLVSVLSASAGGLFVLGRVIDLTPAAAMRPPTPPDFSHIGGALVRLLDQTSRMVLRQLVRQPGRFLGAMIGIASGMALSASMLTIFAGFERTIDLTFGVIDRSDAMVNFTYAASNSTIFELQRLPGVIEVEPVRIVPVVLRNGLYSHRGVVNGLIETPRLNRAIDRGLRTIPMRGDGIILATALADILHIRAGETITVEVREGRQPVLDIPVVGIANSMLGSPAYMELTALNRALREPGRVSGAYLRIDAAQASTVHRALKDMPTIAGVSQKAEARRAFQKVMDDGAASIRYVMGAVAFVITFGIVYNAARIAYAERARDLASLRVIGYTRGEAAFVLLGELAVVTLIALPVGTVMGYYLAFGIAAGFSTELYQISADFNPASYGSAACVVIVAALVSGWLVKRDIDRTRIGSGTENKGIICHGP